MPETWFAVFKLQKDLDKLLEWLERKWSKDNPCTFRLGHSGRIIVEGDNRDSVFKCAQWIRHQNPTGRKLNYSVIGYSEDGKILWVSYCTICREGKEPHYKHSG